MSADRKGHVDVMDGLRGLAIAMVVLFHYWQLSFFVVRLPGDTSLEFVQFAGFLGVELFFFISGFCLFYPYATGKVQTLGHFYYRRAIKILPSYLLALFVLGFIVTDLYPSSWEYGKAADLGVHLLFLHNFWGPTHGSFNGVMWSLAVEVQFYVLFPAFAWFFRRQPIPTAAVMVGISVLYRAWNRGQPENDFGLLADLLPAYLDLFAFGMLAATTMVWIRSRPEAVERLRIPFTAIAGLATILLFIMFDWVYQVRVGVPAGLWQSQNRAYIGALFLVLAVASAFAFPLWRKVLSNRVLVFLSTISYNLYIWHQVVGVWVRKRELWPADTATPTDDPTWRWSYTLIAIGLSIVVASLITYLFERPLLRDGVRGSARKLGARVGLGGGAGRGPGGDGPAGSGPDRDGGEPTASGAPTPSTAPEAPSGLPPKALDADGAPA